MFKLTNVINSLVSLKRKIFLLSGLLSGALSVFAEGGSSVYDFLNIPVSSYVMGIGGANVSSLQPDIDMAQQNPALIGPENDRQLKVGYMRYFGNSNFAGARFGMAAGEHGAWAAGIRYLDYGSFKGFEQDGSSTGSFGAQDIVVEGSYSHDFTYRLRGGINVKMAYSNYENYSAVALAADLGISYYDERHDFSFGFVLKNMGGQVKRFEDSYDHLPFDVQLGITKGFNNGFSFSVTAWHLTKWRLPYYNHEVGAHPEYTQPGFFKNFFRHLVFGIEYHPSEKFYVDLGYNYKTASDMSSYKRNFLSGFSIGAGFKVRAFSVGVAYALPHKGASTVLLNLGLDITELL